MEHACEVVSILCLQATAVQDIACRSKRLTSSQACQTCTVALQRHHCICTNKVQSVHRTHMEPIAPETIVQGEQGSNAAEKAEIAALHAKLDARCATLACTPSSVPSRLHLHNKTAISAQGRCRFIHNTVPCAGGAGAQAQQRRPRLQPYW